MLAGIIAAQLGTPAGLETFGTSPQRCSTYILRRLRRRTQGVRAQRYPPRPAKLGMQRCHAYMWTDPPDARAVMGSTGIYGAARADSVPAPL